MKVNRRKLFIFVLKEPKSWITLIVNIFDVCADLHLKLCSEA